MKVLNVWAWNAPLTRTCAVVCMAALSVIIVQARTATADTGNGAFRCGVVGVMTSSGVPIPLLSNCPNTSALPGASTTVQQSMPETLEHMVEAIISETIASSTIALQSGSTTVTGTVNPLTGLDVQVNTPFGGIHLYDPVCKLIVKKIVVGGTASSSDFMINVFLDGAHISGSPRAGSASGTTYQNLMPGTYLVSETVSAGYVPTFSGDCDASGRVVLPPNGSATCVVTNTFATTTNPGGGTGTSTPPGGGTSTTSPPGGGGGGGGCVVNCSGSSGGGGSNPGGGTTPTTGGGTTPGSVAGVSTSTTPGAGSLPLIPNTGYGDATSILWLLLVSGVFALSGAALLLAPSTARTQ